MDVESFVALFLVLEFFFVLFLDLFFNFLILLFIMRAAVVQLTNANALYKMNNECVSLHYVFYLFVHTSCPSK